MGHISKSPNPAGPSARGAALGLIGFWAVGLLAAGCGDRLPPALDSITINPDVVTLEHGQTQEFTITANYDDGTSADVSAAATLTASSPGVLMVSQNTVTALSGLPEQPVTVTAHYREGDVERSAAAMVTTKRISAALTILPGAPALAAGISAQLTATVSYSDLSTQDVTADTVFTSTDPVYVSVLGNTITGVAPAPTPIIVTASYTENGRTVNASVNVTVLPPVLDSITVNPDAVTLAAGLSAQLSATANYSDLTTQDVTADTVFVSADPGYVSVSGNTITGVAPAPAPVVITASYTENARTEIAAVNVTVVPVLVSSVDYAVIALGARLVITGGGFDLGDTIVTVGGLLQTAVVNSTTQITIPLLDESTPTGVQDVITSINSGTEDSPTFSVTVVRLLVNELDASTTPTNTVQFVEVSAGAGGTGTVVSLAGYTLVVYDGATDLVVAAHELAAATNTSGLLLAGSADLLPPPSIVFPDGTLPAGNAAAVAIYQGLPADFPVGSAWSATRLLDVLVYDTGQLDDDFLLDSAYGVGSPKRKQPTEALNSMAASHSIARTCVSNPRDGRPWSTGAPTPGSVNPPDRVVTFTDISGSSNQRWKDIAGQLYATTFQSDYIYASDSDVTASWWEKGPALSVRIEAFGLKPNFAYQCKLEGDRSDVMAFENIGYEGRWWLSIGGTNFTDSQYEANKDDSGVTIAAYLLFGYFVTDEEGNADACFLLDSTYHVLWSLELNPTNSPGPDDSVVFTHTIVQTGPAYDSPSPTPLDQHIWMEHEWVNPRPLIGQMQLPEYFYPPWTSIVLTEESFHQGGPGAGTWASVLKGFIDFEIVIP